MKAKLLIATQNPAKLARLKPLLAGYELELASLVDVGISDKVPEDQNTFEDNAKLKAERYRELSGLPTLADDGGLMIDELGGWPGVHSRRVWGANEREATDEEALREVLQRLQGVPPERRGAKFVVVVALALPNGSVQLARGEDPGSIALEPGAHRVSGFPYRSLFIPQGRQLPESELEDAAQGKDYLLHRKQAILKLEPYFKELEKQR